MTGRDSTVLLVDEEIVHPECPMCNGEPVVLGLLGSKLWLRCRYCGTVYSKKEDEDYIMEE